MKHDTPPASPVPIAGNSFVNHELLRELANVNARLAAFGLQSSWGYNIAPALGGDVVKAAPPTAPPSANVAFQSIRPHSAD